MTGDQQKAYNIGYNDSKVGKQSNSSNFIPAHSSEFSNYNDATLVSYYTKGYDQYVTDSTKKAGMNTAIIILLAGAFIGIFIYAMKKK